MNKAVYFIYDTETGGLSPANSSLLTLYGAILDKDFNPIDEIDLKLKPDDGIYKVAAGAMRVNKIDLVEHDKVALTYTKGSESLWDFLQRHSNEGKNKLIPVGHNTIFDEKYVQTYLVDDPHWRIVMDYHRLDTIALAFALKIAGVIHAPSISLGKLAKSIGVEIDPNELHNCKVDTMLTRQVLIKMMGMLKK